MRKPEVLILLLFWSVIASAAWAQTFTVVGYFGGTDGDYPVNVVPTQGVSGSLFGTTSMGGSEFQGTIFRITPAGVLSSIANFDGSNGCCPAAGLILGTEGNFYGTSWGGGSNGAGTVFRASPQGAISVLYSFCTYAECADGSLPAAALVQGVDGNFYGTTQYGGYGSCNCGTIFKVSQTGILTVLHSFDATDGGDPNGLIQATDGNFYGTTDTTVFRITPAGELTTIYQFCSQPNCADGGSPKDALAQGRDGGFYGTTSAGGANCVPTGGCGTVFRLTPKGVLTTLYSFCSQSNCSDGAFPYAGLVQDTDGNFYGTTEGGGESFPCSGGCGTIFMITKAGEFRSLHSFDFNTEGVSPDAGLLQATNGSFYGTTPSGSNDGTIYQLNMGLGPFITFVRAAGKVGQTGGILGQGFIGTTGVSLNGVPMNFKIVSDTYLTATVPQGATTGYVTVNTPSGVLKSNVPFYVIR